VMSMEVGHWLHTDMLIVKKCAMHPVLAMAVVAVWW